MSSENKLRDAFIEESKFRLTDYLAQVRHCVGTLTDEQVWWRPNEVTNATGNLLLHLAGNVGMWIIEGVGGERFERDRPAEFAARGPQRKAELLDRLDQVVRRAVEVLDTVEADRLLKGCDIQGYQVSGLSAVYHVVEHFALHSGQIIDLTKLITAKPVSRYDEQGHRVDGSREHP